MAEIKSKHPMIYNSPEALQEAIDNYFDWVDNENIKRKDAGDRLKPYTLSGLCIYLGLSKDTWWEYGKRPEMAETVKEAKHKVENYVEEGLLNSALNTIGAVFNLKNNFGWADKQEVTVNQTDTKLTVDEIREAMKKVKPSKNKAKKS